MKKLVLLIITSFVALGTSAVGIQQDAGPQTVVVGLLSSEVSDKAEDRKSVVEWVR